MTALSPEATTMANLLIVLTQPDTEAIRAAERSLKPLLKDPRCVPALVEILKARDNQPPPVRHVGGILLRKRLPGHYSKFDESVKSALKAEILNVLASEPERTVRNGLVGVAASLGKLECGAGGTSWPELFQFIAAAGADPQPEARELAFGLLQEMTDTIGSHLKAQFQPIAGLFSKALVPQEDPKVQKAAVKAVGQLLSFLAEDPEVDIFACLIPPILEVAARNVSDDELIATVLDVLYDLAYSPSAAVGAHLVSMVQFSLQCIQSTELEMGVRDSAALVIATLAEAKPKTFGKEKALLVQVLDTLFALIENSPDSAAGALFESNPAWRQDLDEDGDGEEYDPEMDSPTETSMAQGTLDMLACEIPKKYIFEPVVSKCVQRLNSPQPNHRKAGIAGLGVVAEGCAEPLRDHLNELMPYVLNCAKDSDPQVRECACFCLGQISEHCQPEILNYSDEILPIVFQLLDDKMVAVQATSCYVLEMFCERLEPDAVRPLLDSLVKKLAAMLESTNKRSVQEMAVAALAATAVAAEEEFAPYVEGVATLMIRCMSLTEERLYSLRGRALECMGHMAIAVGRDNFRPYFQVTMECACEGLTRDSSDLHEFAYAVFANLAKVMKEEFAPALPELVPHLVSIIGQEEGQLEPAEENENAGEFGAFDDSDDEDEEGGNFVLHVRTAMLEVKKGAITAIGELAAHTGAAFVPHLESVMQVLQKAATNWHPLIKTEVADALPSMVVPSVSAYHAGEIPWNKGEISGPNPMCQHTQAIVGAVLTELINMLTDDDKMVVAKACEGIQSVIELCGPYALAPVANECLQGTHALLTKTAPCQESDDYLGEAPEEDDDHDLVTQAACDLVGGFCRVMGSQFAQYLPQFLPAVLEYAKSSRPTRDRSMAIGWLSEVAQELEDSIMDFWQLAFFPAIMSSLADPSDDVKRNAAFCAGVCCEKLKDRVVANYGDILQAVEPLFSIDASSGESAAACVDNAAACVARMVITSPASVPMPQVLPAMLRLLPLKTDMTENETVYTCLIGLIEVSHPDAVANKSEILRVFSEACAQGSKVDPEIQSKLRDIMPKLQ
ncbi:heat repeat-containing protein [Nitzschia inconspicua]|uniref:Heat repeat-containing protein n=1 Tax=Nitzschia inconspicua TaxID=303405 RepID=A0A9K3PYK8_9STRA|nr:heat repeat-containing protein [Nitzschia inconspicua]